MKEAAVMPAKDPAKNRRTGGNGLQNKDQRKSTQEKIMNLYALLKYTVKLLLTFTNVYMTRQSNDIITFCFRLSNQFIKDDLRMGKTEEQNTKNLLPSPLKIHQEFNQTALQLCLKIILNVPYYDKKGKMFCKLLLEITT